MFWLWGIVSTIKNRNYVGIREALHENIPSEDLPASLNSNVILRGVIPRGRPDGELLELTSLAKDISNRSEHVVRHWSPNYARANGRRDEGGKGGSKRGSKNENKWGSKNQSKNKS